MKKILSIFGAVAVLVASTALISCGDSGDEFNGATDTVLSLPAPSVKATAYPGVNYITWEPIAQATSYELYRTTDGATGARLLKSGSDTAYADIAGSTSNGDFNISDGKSYKYTVIAIAGNRNDVPSRAIYIKSSQGSATVTAKVPAAGSSIGDEKAFSYYKSFFEKFNDANLAKNVVITPAQYDKASSGKWGGYYVSYPATAGLEFKVVQIEESAYGTGLTDGDIAKTDGFSSANYKENFTANKAITTLGSGTKDIYLVINSVADTLYQPIVKKIGSADVKGINENNKTTGITAKYITSTTAEIWWTPAILTETGDYTDAGNYVVYRTSSADNYDNYTPISGSITAKKIATIGDTGDTVSIGNATEGAATGSVKGDEDGTDVKVVYSITDTITDNTATYKYYVVHKIDEYYGAQADAATLKPFANKTDTPSLVSATVPVKKSATEKTEIQILAKKGNANQKLVLKYAELAKDYANNTVERFSDFTETVELKEASNYAGDNLTFVAYVTGKYNTDYVFQLYATETGKDDSDKVYASVSAFTPSNDEPSAYITDDDVASDQNYAVVVIDSSVQGDFYLNADSFENYVYKLYKVTTTANRYYDDYVTVTEEEISDGGLTIAVLTDANRTKYGITGNTKEDMTSDSTGATQADYVSITKVTAPKPTEDDKYNQTVSVRFYVVKTLKNDSTTPAVYADVTDSTGAFTGIQVK